MSQDIKEFLISRHHGIQNEIEKKDNKTLWLMRTVEDLTCFELAK